MEVREAFRDPAGMVGSAANLLVVYIEATPDVAHLEAVMTTYRRALREHPAGVGTVVMVRGGAPRLSEDFRNALVELARVTEEGALGTAFVILPRGLFAAAVRAFLTGVFLAARSKEPLKVFATVSEASGWLVRVLGDEVPWTAERIAGVLRPLAGL